MIQKWSNPEMPPLKRRILFISLGLLAACFAMACLAMTLGALSLPDLWEGLRQSSGPERTSEYLMASSILWDIRFPRVLLALLMGAVLGACGSCYQALFRNPLAEPYLLGVSMGASAGVVAWLLLAGSGLDFPGARALSAFAGAMLAALAVWGVARTGSGLDTHRMILAGVVVNAFLSSLVLFVISISPMSDMATVFFYIMGNLGMASTASVLGNAAWIIPGLIALSWTTERLNLLMIGEDYARSLGVSVENLKRTVFILSSLLIAGVVALGGVVGFVGLMVPHAARALWGSDNRIVYPASIGLGALLMLASDTAGRLVLMPREIPVGVVTALLGVPFFMVFLFRSLRR